MKTKVFEILRVLLFVLFGLMLLIIVYNALTQLSINQQYGYRLYAPFSDLQQLQIGDDVRVAGVRVGSVINTYLDNGRAVAVLSIEKRYVLPEDSLATILMSGLLGANYVSISPGKSAVVFKSGGYVKTQQTANMASVIQQFSRVGKKLDHILGDLSENSEEEGGMAKLFTVVDNLKIITNQIAAGEGTLGRIIMEERLYNDLISLLDATKSAVNKIEKVVDNVQAGNGLLGKLIVNEKTSQDFDHIVKNINEFCEKLNNDKSTLGRLITNDELYQKANGVLNKVEKASDNIANTGPVTALGAAASALF